MTIARQCPAIVCEDAYDGKCGKLTISNIRKLRVENSRSDFVAVIRDISEYPRVYIPRLAINDLGGVPVNIRMNLALSTSASQMYPITRTSIIHCASPKSNCATIYSLYNIHHYHYEYKIGVIETLSTCSTCQLKIDNIFITQTVPLVINC